jgi:hypothetical protein
MHFFWYIKIFILGKADFTVKKSILLLKIKLEAQNKNGGERNCTVER